MILKQKTTSRTGPVIDSIPLKYRTILNSQNRETNCAASKTLDHGTDCIALQVQNKLNIQSERVNFNLVTIDFSTSKLYVLTEKEELFITHPSTEKGWKRSA